MWYLGAGLKSTLDLGKEKIQTVLKAIGGAPRESRPTILMGVQGARLRVSQSPLVHSG